MTVKTVLSKLYNCILPKCMKNNISALDFFEDHIDFIQVYHDALDGGLDVPIEFVSEMCEAFVRFDEVRIVQIRL